jgi:hypothetical protein
MTDDTAVDFSRYEGLEREDWTVVEYGDGDSLAIHHSPDNRVCFMATHGGSEKAWRAIQKRAELIADAPKLLSALRQSQAENGRLTAAASWFALNGKSIVADIRSAHLNRGDGASQWMREDDADFRTELGAALDDLRAAERAARDHFGDANDMIDSQMSARDRLLAVILDQGVDDWPDLSFDEERTMRREYVAILNAAIAYSRAALTQPQSTGSDQRPVPNKDQSLSVEGK